MQLTDPSSDSPSFANSDDKPESRAIECAACGQFIEEDGDFCEHCGAWVVNPNLAPFHYEYGPAKQPAVDLVLKDERQEIEQEGAEKRKAQTAREPAVRQTNTLAAALEVGRKAYQEEKRKVQLAAEARRRDEEQQLHDRELQRGAEEEARNVAEEEERRAAERVREKEAARALAEQERRRVAETQRQQAEKERLATELQQRVREREVRRAKDAAITPSPGQGLTRADTEDESEPKLPETPLREAGPESAEPSLVDTSTTDKPKFSNNKGSLESSDVGGTFDVDKAADKVHSWDLPAMFTVPQSRSNPRVWLVGLLVVVVIGVIVAVISTRERVSTGVNADIQPTPTPVGPIVPAGMVRIPGGEFSMGSDRPNADQQEKPVHKVTVTAFYIDATEVTCEDYQKFVKATGRKAPAKWLDGSCPSGDVRKPVTGVDWYDASAYAKWANKRLPTEEEWEFAARGTDGRRYPWGRDWRSDAANAGNSTGGQLADVGSYPAGKGPFGTMDMIGNAWEWTASEWQGYPGGPIPPDASNRLRVIRGGYWGSSAAKATTTFRRGWDARGASQGYQNTGFRCAADLKAQTSKK